MITQDALKSLLHYDPKTGAFTWIADRASGGIRRGAIGDVAGSHQNRGYLRIQINGAAYLCHRLAWLYMTGHWPVEIDHINGVRSDNRWSNLRSVDHSTNCQNERRARKNNRTGLRGVKRSLDKFVARIYAQGQQCHLGTFDTAEQAHTAYMAAKKKLHAGFTA